MVIAQSVESYHFQAIHEVVVRVFDHVKALFSFHQDCRQTTCCTKERGGGRERGSN